MKNEEYIMKGLKDMYRMSKMIGIKNNTNSDLRGRMIAHGLRIVRYVIQGLLEELLGDDFLTENTVVKVEK